MEDLKIFFLLDAVVLQSLFQVCPDLLDVSRVIRAPFFADVLGIVQGCWMADSSLALSSSRLSSVVWVADAV